MFWRREGVVPESCCLFDIGNEKVHQEEGALETIYYTSGCRETMGVKYKWSRPAVISKIITCP